MGIPSLTRRLTLAALLSRTAMGVAADAPPPPWTADDVLLAESARGRADRPAKATGPSAQAGEAYRGLRVVVGKASGER